MISVAPKNFSPPIQLRNGIHQKISVYIKTYEGLLQKLHTIFRRVHCVFCRFRKDWETPETQ